MPLNHPMIPALLADPEIFQQNRLPPHAYFSDQTSPAMPLTVSLNGEWAFRYAENLTAPFSNWDTLTVPGIIQMQSLQKPGQPYGAPHYVSTRGTATKSCTPVKFRRIITPSESTSVVSPCRKAGQAVTCA